MNDRLFHEFSTDCGWTEAEGIEGCRRCNARPPPWGICWFDPVPRAQQDLFGDRAPTPQPPQPPQPRREEQLALPGLEPVPRVPRVPRWLVPLPPVPPVMSPLEAERLRGIDYIRKEYARPEEVARLRGWNGGCGVGPVEAALAAALHVERSDFEAAFRLRPGKRLRPGMRQPLRWVISAVTPYSDMACHRPGMRQPLRWR